MPKRNLFIIGLAMATITCAVPVVAYLFRDPINPSTCERIQEGMSEPEVIAILGRPCDSELRYLRGAPPLMREGASSEACPITEKTWNGPTGRIAVDFDDNCRVERVTCFFADNDNDLLPKIRRWLGIDPDPSQLTPYRIHGGVRLVSSGI
jgi:hypothetical protein